MPDVAVNVVTVIVPPVMATEFAFCSAIVPIPDKVWLAFQAAAPLSLNESSAGVEWAIAMVMLRTVIYTRLIGKGLLFRQLDSVLQNLFRRKFYSDQLQFLLVDFVENQSRL